jgi:hypothetical protein
MPKLAFWADDEMDERLDRLHRAMLSDPALRDLKLKKTDVIKMLIRRSLDWAVLEQLRELPEGTEPEDARKALDQQHNRLTAILDTMATWKVTEAPPPETDD